MQRFLYERVLLETDAVKEENDEVDGYIKYTCQCILYWFKEYLKQRNIKIKFTSSWEYL